MADRMTTVNPATGETIADYELMTDAEVDRAVKACHAAFDAWRLTTHAARARQIRKIGAALRDHKDAFARLMTKETGKLIGDGRDEVELCAQICDYTAETGPTALADEEREIPGGTGVITYAPIGVIYGIQPWNFPAYQVVRYAIANLMAGNGVLLKHAEICTGSGLFLRDLFAGAGLPEDLFTVLVIDHDQSDAVIAHRRVRGVTLTGSDGAGATVAEQAARELKKTVLELGSNDAYLVLDEADLELAVETCVKGRLFNTGQTCVSAKRFIITEKNYDAFLDGFVDGMTAIESGDPTDEATQLGPMASTDLRKRLHAQVQQSVENGARLLCGGEMPGGAGAFYPPTVLVDVAPGQPAYEDELFGPAAAVIKAKDDWDAMRIANDSRYGLGGGIFCRDVDHARRLASQHFDTGMVCINRYTAAIPNMPFGGVKDSGYGREHGGFGLKEFVNAKSLYLA